MAIYYVPAASADPLVNGADLQAQVDAMGFGDRIRLDPFSLAGRSYGFTFALQLPNNAGGTGTDADFMFIEPGNASTLMMPVADGVRCGLSDAPNCAKIVNHSYNDCAVRMLAGAHHWHLRGLDITTISFIPVGRICSAIVLSDLDTEVLSSLPHHITFDRVLIHPAETGDGPTTNFRSTDRGVSIAGRSMTLTNSSICDFGPYEAPYVDYTQTEPSGPWTGWPLNHTPSSPGILGHITGIAGNPAVVTITSGVGGDIPFTDPGTARGNRFPVTLTNGTGAWAPDFAQQTFVATYINADQVSLQTYDPVTFALTDFDATGLGSYAGQKICWVWSYCSTFNAVGNTNGPGPFVMDNNLVDAYVYGFFAGGGGTTVPDGNEVTVTAVNNIGEVVLSGVGTGGEAPLTVGDLIAFKDAEPQAISAISQSCVSHVATSPSPATSGTTLVVTTGHGANFPPTPFFVQINAAGFGTYVEGEERATCTNVSGDTLTLTRAGYGSTARTILVGDRIVAPAVMTVPAHRYPVNSKLLNWDRSVCMFGGTGDWAALNHTPDTNPRYEGLIVSATQIALYTDYAPSETVDTSTFSQPINGGMTWVPKFGHTQLESNPYWGVQEWAIGKVTAIAGTTVTYDFAGHSVFSLYSFHRHASGNGAGVPVAVGSIARFNGHCPADGSIRRNRFILKRYQIMLVAHGCGVIPPGGTAEPSAGINFPSPKGVWEVKTLQNVDIEGNLFEVEGGSMDPWPAAPGVKYNHVNQAGATPWINTFDNRYRGNIFRHMTDIWIVNQDEYNTSEGGSVLFEHNLVYGDTNGCPFLSLGGTHTGIVRHNTYIATGPGAGDAPTGNYILYDRGGPFIGPITWEDNITAIGSYGYYVSLGTVTYADWNITRARNFLVDTVPVGSGNPQSVSGLTIPPDTYLSTLADMMFVDAADALNDGDYHGFELAGGSPGIASALDGSNAGVDFAVLDALQAGEGGEGVGAITRLGPHGVPMRRQVEIPSDPIALVGSAALTVSTAGAITTGIPLEAAGSLVITTASVLETGGGDHPVGAITRLGPHGVPMRRQVEIPPGPDLVPPMAVTLDEFSGVVDHVEQVVEEDGRYVEVHLLDLDLGVFDTPIPSVKVTTALFGAQAVDLGMTIPKILGNVVRSPLRYINDGTGSDQYDYAVTHGSGYTVTKVERKTGFADRQFETISASLYTVSAETYGAYTITRIRLTRRQTGFDGSFYELFADVTGVAADRNPARAFRVLLADTAYGLSQTVDTASTDAAEAVLTGIGNMFVDGTLAEARPAREWLEQLFVMRGLRPGYGANGWALTVDQEQTTAALAIRSGPGPGEKNLLRAPRRAKTRPLQEQVKTYTLEYSYDHASETYLYPQSRTVASVGVDKTLSLDLVRNHTTARKVLVYLSRREQYGADQVDLVIGEEGRHIDIGDIVQVTYAPLGLSSADMEVRSIERGRGEHTILAVGWDPAIYDDDGGALPTDQSIDTSLVPPAASNLSIDSSGTYQASDGTTKAFVILEVDVPTSPAIAYARVDAKRSSQSVWNQGVAIISTQGVNIDSQVLGLEPNVAYDYRVVTVSGAGKEGSAVTITSQTTPEDTTAPATPVNLTVSSAATQIHMRVDPNTEDDLGEYEFDIRTASGGGGTEIAIFRKRSNAFVINPIATDASFVSAGTAVADAATPTLTLTAPTFTGAQAPNSILIASIIGLNNQVVTPPGGWFSAGEENNTAAMRVNNFWTPASGKSGLSYNFTKPVDDNLLAFGVITLWRDVDLNVVLGTGGFKHNAVADAISYPNVDPGTLNRYLMVAIGYYADNATTAGAISGTNPTFANHVDQETATGGGASIFIASATSDGRATGNRTQATSSTTDAINTGYFFSLVPVAMQYGTTYYARARAYDRTGNVSAWGTAAAFVHKAVATKDIEADATSDLTVFSGSGSFAENGGLVTIITGTVTVLGPNSVLVVHSLVIGTQAADSAGLVWNTQMTNSYNSDNLQTIETSSASEVHTLMAVASTENVTPGNVTVTLKIQANGDSGANPTYVARLEILEIRR